MVLNYLAKHSFRNPTTEGSLAIFRVDYLKILNQNEYPRWGIIKPLNREILFFALTAHSPLFSLLLNCLEPLDQ